MRKDIKKIFFLVLFCLGMVIATQFRTIIKLNSSKPSYAHKLEIVRADLIEEKKINKSLKELVNKNTVKKEEYLKSFIEGKDDAITKQEWEDTKFKAGLTDVKGKGIIITINDAMQKKDEDVNLLIIHDSDLLKILNELRKAGSQAISINEERIISISEQVCAGPTIRINKKSYAVPFKIKVIGDPDILYKELDKSNIVYSLRYSGIKVDINKQSEIFIPKYNGSLENLLSGVEVAK